MALAYQTALTIESVIKDIDSKNTCCHPFKENLFGVQGR